LQLDGDMSAVALSEDKSLLAAGHREGEITLRSFPQGKEITKLRADRMRITCLAFQKDRLRREGPANPTKGWLLAAGDSSATVTLWDCEMRAQRATCRGSDHHVHAVAFSPDGMTLASVGRFDVMLWDVVTGRLLLKLPATNWLNDVAFS